MIVFHMRAPTKKKLIQHKESWNFFIEDEKKSLVLSGRSFLWSSRAATTAVVFLQPSTIWIPNPFPNKSASCKMLNGPHKTSNALYLLSSICSRCVFLWKDVDFYCISLSLSRYPGSPGPSFQLWWWRPAAWRQGKELSWRETRKRPVRLWWTSWRYETIGHFSVWSLLLSRQSCRKYSAVFNPLNDYELRDYLPLCLWVEMMAEGY